MLRCGISNRPQYTPVGDQISLRDFGRLEGKVDQMLSLIQDRGSRLDSLEARMRKVEEGGSYSAGRRSVLTVLLSIVTSAAIALGARFVNY